MSQVFIWKSSAVMEEANQEGWIRVRKSYVIMHGLFLHIIKHFWQHEILS